MNRLNSKPLRFTFNGKSYTGTEGDTLASALLANGVRVLARSFKYHRPRGLMAAGDEEPNALVAVGRGARLETNTRATQIELVDGLEANSINAWPSVNFDVGAAADLLYRFLPGGFYYKTFTWPDWTWFEGFIRRAAGMGTSATVPDPDRYEHRHAHCDVLVIGGGAAGLAAAHEAANADKRVILVESQPQVGGALLWTNEKVDGWAGSDWARNLGNQLKARPNVTVLTRTTVAGAYDHNYFTAVERVNGVVRERLWHIRAGKAVLATGAIERPLVFPDNDRPGVMLASAVRQYLNRYGVRCGERVVIATNNDSAYPLVRDLLKAGVNVVAVIDMRTDVAPNVDNVTHLKGYGIVKTKGRGQVTGVEAAQLDGQGQRWSLACDVVAMSGGWTPTDHLLCQAGGKLRYDDARGCFVPDRLPKNMSVVGAANGDFDLAACLPAPWTCEGEPAFNILPRTLLPKEITGPARQWIDFQNDVCVSDVTVAAAENYTSVEHLKRYTTLGMAPDQGKTSNVNGLALMAELTGRAIPAVGTTTFRPPYTPVTFGAIAGRRVGALYSPSRLLPTHARQVALNGHLQDFGGWQRAEFFPKPGETEDQTITREVMAVRNNVGIIDYSPLGKIEVSGPDAVTFLNRMVVTNVETLKAGKARYNFILNEMGIVIDDGIVSRLADGRFLVGTTSGGAARITSMFEDWHQGEWPDLKVFIDNVTTGWGVALITGPKARELLARVGTDIDISSAAFPHMSVREGTIAGVPTRIHRVSFSGEVSYEIAVPTGYMTALWDELMAKGADLGITPFGIESLMTMRVEKGFLHVGSDTDGTTMPQDIGFGEMAKRKTIDYVGRRSIHVPHGSYDKRLQLVGLESIDLLPVGAHLVNASIKSVPALTEGHVTSSRYSPTLKKPVALGLLAGGTKRMGETVSVYDHDRWYTAKVVGQTFYDPQGERING